MSPHLTGPFQDNAFQLMHNAIRWWQRKGFQYVDLPWIVPRQYSDATRPPSARDISTSHGSFVASGEQSFLQLWDEGRLSTHRTDALGSQEQLAEVQGTGQVPVPGYIGWTPCLRDEPVLDEHHQHGFMKAEWFVPLSSSQSPNLALAKLIERQIEMFEFVAGDSLDQTGCLAVLPQANLQFDLVLCDIEIGSYGVRTFKDKAYIYGTALALPRFSQAVATHRA